MRIAALLLLFSIGTCVADEPFAQEKQIREYVQHFLDAEVCNAVSIGVIHGDQTWTAHFGKLSDQKPIAPNDQTMYEIGSVSKVLTGNLLAYAVETGSVKLDQPIGTLMAKLQETNKDVAESITLKHLSTHNSGLPRMPDNFTPADPQNPYADYDRQQLADFISVVKPKDKPNTVTAYSNLAVGLLGDLMAAKADLDYQTLMKQTITDPLNMSDTTIHLTKDQLSRMAPPHNDGLGDARMWDFNALTGAGGIRSTVPDMMRFIAAVMHPDDTTLGKAMELAWQQQVPARGGQFAMGLGWHIARDGSTRWHNGQTAGYHAMLMVNRDLQAGVIVLSNTAAMQVDAIGESIIQMIAGMEVKPPKFAQVKKVDEEQIKRLVGKYKLFPTFILDVRLEKGRLMVQATNQPAIRIYPESITQWKYRAVEAQVTFELPDQGPAAALTLHQNGRDMRGSRITE